jgi:cystathionine beta-lyase/cystathionine gamma-synthase
VVVTPLPVARRAGVSPDDALSAALADLDDDLAELAFLCAAALERLTQLETELANACPYRRTRDVLARATASAQRRYRAVAGQLRLLRTQALHAPRSEPLVANLAAERASLADRLRAEQSMLAGLLAAPDWQSPAFLSSLAPAAGRQAGRIHAHWNDYKRDRHGDAEDYERRYVERMIDGPPGTRALLTSCGMASFTTILWCLEAEGKLGRPVLAGRGLYHETRTLLERALPGRVRFVDETDTASLLQAIDATRPSALFLDSLSNTGLMPAPDLHAVIECLRGADTYLIVDNTCLSVSCQPLALAGESLRVVVFESLLKYAQLGLDRANAGVIVARRRDAEMLDAYREHLGTNISDVAVHALPPPDRGVLERRLARLERNAIHLAERLNERARADVAIVYPGMDAHAGGAGAARLPFRGGCLSLVFGEPGRRERLLVSEAVAEAGRRGLALHGGSSFGFDTTRIYLAAARAECGTPFVRIAAGTEHRLELDALADALAAAVEGVCSSESHAAASL